MPGEPRTASAHHPASEHTQDRPAAAPGRVWRPAPFIKLSFAWHGAAVAAVAFAPPVWPWALGSIVLNHLLLTGVGLWPRSQLLGPNLVRLPEPAAARRQVALTFDDGPDPEATPRVLDLLDAAGVRATFFCIGRRARQFPAVVRDIAARGHRVENHGDSHLKNFATYGYKRLRDDIGAAQATLEDMTGQRPLFFRPLGGLRSPILDPVLAHLDLRQACWTRRGFDSVRGDPQRVFEHITRGLQAGDILLLHDGDAARTPAGEPVSLVVLPRLLAALREASLQPVTLAEAVL
jgi:peptidoglycan/xylan/chitin deacetylase (PgdA/CDA1 family)